MYGELLRSVQQDRLRRKKSFSQEAGGERNEAATIVAFVKSTGLKKKKKHDWATEQQTDARDSTTPH